MWLVCLRRSSTSVLTNCSRVDTRAPLSARAAGAHQRRWNCGLDLKQVPRLAGQRGILPRPRTMASLMTCFLPLLNAVWTCTRPWRGPRLLAKRPVAARSRPRIRASAGESVAKQRSSSYTILLFFFHTQGIRTPRRLQSRNGQGRSVSPWPNEPSPSGIVLSPLWRAEREAQRLVRRPPSCAPAL